MLSKDEVKQMKWYMSEYSDFIYWVPDEVKIGDVGFVGDVEERFVLKECTVVDVRKLEKYSDDSDSILDAIEFYKARSQFSEPHDYTAEFFVGDKDFVVALKFVSGNSEVSEKDFNVIATC